MQPAGILKNTATNRFHHILFRPAPTPSGSDQDMTAQRYLSAGHHTAGFDTLEQAQEEIEVRGWGDCGIVWEWDGQGVPAMTEWFSPKKAA